ncbi:MAG: hypothetical protein J7K75_05365 [Desulfuromonas sp.]|nr:hypothetical protein [Desulfuromonas sp.]
MNKIKQRLKDFLSGELVLDMDENTAILGQFQGIVDAGIEADADAMIVARRIGKRVVAVGVVGKSLLQGAALTAYLEKYLADADGLDRHITGMVDYLYKDLVVSKAANLMLRSGDLRWRSFVPVKNIDEVLSAATTVN